MSLEREFNTFRKQLATAFARAVWPKLPVFFIIKKWPRS
jgi:hypothetical protein